MPFLGLVDLVDRHDGPQPDLEGLGQNELGLRHRAFGSVHKDNRAIDHRQDTLDFAAEIGVAWRIDDIDPRVLPVQRRDLGQNGDAALFFQIVGIHDAFIDALVVAEGAGLPQQDVDQRRFAMVNVGNDRNIAQAHKGASHFRDLPECFQQKWQPLLRFGNATK